MGRRRSNQVERFWAGVDKTGDCWIWQGAIRTTGYGTFRVTEPERRMVGTHRYSYELTNGPIREGMVIDHICRERRCVNPRHLREVTPQQNMEHQDGHRDSLSGRRGVIWHKQQRKWQARVSKDGKSHSGGLFANPDDAAEAARQLRLVLFTHNDIDRAAS